MASFVTNQYRGKLASLDGESLTVALMDPSYVGGADDTDLSSVSGELDTQDAPGYLRQTVTGVWDSVDGVLRWDDPPSFDAAGADEIQTILIADDTGDIVAGLVWSTPIAGVDGMVPEVEHVAAVADEAGVVARLDDHGHRIAALEQAPGGGGPTEMTGLLSTGEPAGLIPVTDGTGGVTLDPMPSGGGGGGVVVDPEVDMMGQSAPSVTVDLTDSTAGVTTRIAALPAGTTLVNLDMPTPATGMVMVGLMGADQTVFDIAVVGQGTVAEGFKGVAVISLATFGFGGGTGWLPVSAPWGAP